MYQHTEIKGFISTDIHTSTTLRKKAPIFGAFLFLHPEGLLSVSFRVRHRGDNPSRQHDRAFECFNCLKRMPRIYVLALVIKLFCVVGYITTRTGMSGIFVSLTYTHRSAKAHHNIQTAPLRRHHYPLRRTEITALTPSARNVIPAMPVRFMSRF